MAFGELRRETQPGVVRVGEGAGFSGAWLDPAVELAQRGNLDYLLFECLAERTIALAQLSRLTDPGGGYDPHLVRRMEAVLPHCWPSGTRIITNSGAANPAGAGERVVAIARKLGLSGLRVGVVTGDDVLDALDLDANTIAETGQTLRDIAPAIVSANAYIGAEPLVEALDRSAHVVIGGRIADPSLVLAALGHAFRWSVTDWERLGAGIAVGHLLECGPQVTGGYFGDPGVKEVGDLSRIGAPIAECWPDGTATITKLPATGGVVTTATCTEQLLYEIHDPAAYYTPDVIADFSRVQFSPEGQDRIAVHGASGRPRPETLKVAVGYRDGFIGEGQISYGGAGCVNRARQAADAVLARLANQGIDLQEVRVDLIGLTSLFGAAQPGPAAEPPEVRLRLAARTADRASAEAVGLEVEGLWIAGPYGGGGASRSVREVIAVGSVYVPRSTVRTTVTILEA